MLDARVVETPRPGLATGPYPERQEPIPSRPDRVVLAGSGALTRRLRGRLAHLRTFVERVEHHGRKLEKLSQPELDAARERLRARLRRRGPVEALLAPSFALIREQAGRTLGMRHHDVQLMGGYAMARGRLAEMATGEGKTLTATLPAAVAALAGIPVHVLSSNDYLVARDAEKMGPLYEALGLSVAAVTEDVKAPEARRALYRRNVVYVTGRVVAFDFLRDELARGPARSPLALRTAGLTGGDGAPDELLLRGLCFGIVDEADHVLIDEASTPLILARQLPSQDRDRVYKRALRLARTLEPERDFSVSGREITLSEAGRARLAELAEPLGPPWTGERHREEWVGRALAALHAYHRDLDYIVREDRIEIVDAATGRAAPDRSWEGGLHQLVELKESCPTSPEQETLARISVQQFFRRYLRLAGMTGTASEVAGELWSVYRLQTVRIPTRLPVRRRDLGLRVHGSLVDKWRDVGERAAALRREGRPVLIGTGSVEASEALSQELTARGLPHRVLNARQDAEEARIVAEAGAPGCVTVATHMAGRGTDIPLAPGVAEQGGLHVIVTEQAPARRIDRQLHGRCARQGDPGSIETILSLEDASFSGFYPSALRDWLARRAASASLTGKSAKALTSLPQRAEESREARMRSQVITLDERMNELLAFSGSHRSGPGSHGSASGSHRSSPGSHGSGSGGRASSASS